MQRLLSTLFLVSLSLPCLARPTDYDPVLLKSYFSNMRQIHAPLFVAMETYCQTHRWPSNQNLDTVLTQGFAIPTVRFRAHTVANTFALQYQAWPAPEWFVTIQPHTSQINHRPYFHLQLTSKTNVAMLGVDGMANCREDSHLSDISLLLRDANDPAPASLARVIQQRDFAELGKTPHLNASYRG